MVCLPVSYKIETHPRLEVHDPAALVACCQQLVECAVGIRPEAPKGGSGLGWRVFKLWFLEEP